MEISNLEKSNGKVMSQITELSHSHYMSSIRTDFGWMRPISDGNSLIKLEWNQDGWQDSDCPDNVSRETTCQLQAFFKKQLSQFTLPLAPLGISTVAKKWLDHMANIPYGSTMTYTEFASFAGQPNAARAAGSSCAKNPIPIIYPCHRVIRTDGTLGCYSGGSGYHSGHADNLARKATLIRFESR